MPSTRHHHIIAWVRETFILSLHVCVCLHDCCPNVYRPAPAPLSVPPCTAARSESATPAQCRIALLHAHHHATTATAVQQQQQQTTVTSLFIRVLPLLLLIISHYPSIVLTFSSSSSSSSFPTPFPRLLPSALGSPTSPRQSVSPPPVPVV